VIKLSQHSHILQPRCALRALDQHWRARKCCSKELASRMHLANISAVNAARHHSLDGSISQLSRTFCTLSVNFLVTQSSLSHSDHTTLKPRKRGSLVFVAMFAAFCVTDKRSRGEGFLFQLMGAQHHDVVDDNCLLVRDSVLSL